MVIGYARVSTDQQDTEAQLPDLRKAGCRRVYQETVGGTALDRPELDKCLERLNRGDTLVVWRLDRLGRSIRDLLQIVDRLDKNDIHFVSLKEKFDTSTAVGRLIFHVFATLTQFERELIRERTMAGSSAAQWVAARDCFDATDARSDDNVDSREHTRPEIAAHFSV